MKKYDVVVAGGGPAGSAAALTLARAGLRVLLAHAQGAADFRVGEGLPPQARSLLAELGVLECTLEDGHRRSYGVLSAWGTEELKSRDFIYFPYGHGLQLDRARFDRMLRSSAAEAGVDVYQPARLRMTSKNRLDTEYCFDLNLEFEGGVQKLRCFWLIDATGRSAAVSHLFGATRIRKDSLVAFYLRLGRSNDGVDEEGSTLVEAEEDGWWYTVLLPSGERLVVYLTDADLVDRRSMLTTTGFLGRLCRTRYVREMAARHPVEQTAVPHGADACSSHLDRMGGDRWIAVGDAAMAFDPLSSKGISNALYTGCRGAHAILTAKSVGPGACSSFQQHLEDIFATYEVHLRAYYSLERRWSHFPFWRRRVAYL